MRTVAFVVIAALTLACGASVVGGEKQNPRQEQQTHRSLLPASRSWPEQWGQRKLHRYEQALVYAQKRSVADEVVRVLRTVVEKARQEGVTEPAAGLIVVIDAQERSPIEIAKLTEILNDPNTRPGEEESQEILNSIKEVKKLSDQAGTDMNSVAFILPIPIRPAVLPKVAKESPEGVEQEIAWCVIVPTDRYVRTAMRATMDAMIKIDRMNWKERLLIGALTPLAQHEAEKRVRKTRQADLYQLLVESQKGLSAEAKKEKVTAYRRKLGLDGASEPQGNPGQTKVKQEGRPEPQ